MTRARALALGLTLIAGAGGWYASVRGSGAVAVIEGEGRYRDGRGRMGREGPPSVGGASCTTVAAPSGVTPSSPSDYTAGWSLLNGGGPVVPVITAAAAMGPDCVAGSAQRIDLPAVGAASYSGVYQAVGGANGCPTPAGNQDQGQWYQGVSTGGTINLCTLGINPACVSCAVTAGTWTRCERLNVNTGATGDFFFGYAASETGGITGPAFSFYAWGADCVDH